MTTDLKALADTLEATDAITGDSASQVKAALSGRVSDALRDAMDAEALGRTDFVLSLLDECLHGWAIHLTGRARSRNGDWNCSLRMSDTRDDDAFLGHAQGPHLPNVLTAAMLRALVHISD